MVAGRGKEDGGCNDYLQAKYQSETPLNNEQVLKQ
jgi:hypothetical protein